MAKEILTRAEDLFKVEAARYIFFLGGVEDLNKDVHHCLSLVIAVKMAGKLLAQCLQSSMGKEGGHMLRVRVFLDYLVVEVELAEEEAIAVQRIMQFLCILQDEVMAVLEHGGEQGIEFHLDSEGP